MVKKKSTQQIYGYLFIFGVVLIGTVLWFVIKEFRFKKFEDPQHRFSIYYPANWSVLLNSQGAEAVFLSPKENEMDSFKENVNIVIQDISAHPLDLKEYTKLAINQMQAVFKHNFLLLESKKASLGGFPGHKLSFVGRGSEAELQYLIYWSLKGTTAYQLTYTAVEPNYDTFLIKAIIMAKSFKILN